MAISLMECTPKQKHLEKAYYRPELLFRSNCGKYLKSQECRECAQREPVQPAGVASEQGAVGSLPSELKTSETEQDGL